MKRVAVFDFDNTLITGDAFMPFLSFVAGTLPTYATAHEGAARYALKHIQKQPTESLRTFVKGFLIGRILKGKKIEELQDAIARTVAWQKFNEPMMRELREHREKGDTIVVASGSLDLYLPALLKDIPHDALICTDIGVKEGVITGEMTNGNCVRRCKAERIKAWLEANGPFDESFGYGNYPHDVQMLELVKHRVIVS